MTDREAMALSWIPWPPEREKAIAKAMEDAYRRGRREGLEEAAKVCEDPEQEWCYDQCVRGIAIAIRALAEGEK